MDNKKNPWKKLSSKVVYKNDWYFVREDQVIKPTGKKGLYAVVVTPPSVFTVALTAKDEIYFVGQFRYTSGKYSLELPAGSSDNQDLLEAAKRELKEETGLEAKKWTKISLFHPLNGVASEVSNVFLAQELTEVEGAELEEEGILEIIKIPFEKVLEMIRSGEISDGQSIAAIMQVGLYLEKIK